MAKKKEDKFDKLARLIKQEGEDIRSEIKGLERRMDVHFTGIERRLDNTIQPQLDNHARRIKVLEIKVAQR